MSRSKKSLIPKEGILRRRAVPMEAGFDYIVKPVVIPRVAFGSGLERVTLPLSGPSLSPFMRRVQGGDVRAVLPGPADYAISKGLELKYPSKFGYSAFVSKIPRLPHTKYTSPPAYDIEQPRDMRQRPKPFGIGGKLEPPEAFLTPGPPTYPYHIRYPKLRVSTAFGSKRVTWPAVTVFCSPFNTSKCMDCGQTPVGDYWHHFTAHTDKCRPCMNKQLQVLRACNTDVFKRIKMNRELAQFKQARHCSFFHDHSGTTAAMQLMSNRTYRYKTEQENYLFGFECNARL